MSKLTIEEKILKAADEHPEELTTQRSFARFVNTRYKTGMTESAMRYHVSKLVDDGQLSFEDTIEETIQEDIERYRSKTGDTQLKRQYKKLLEDYVKLSDFHDDLLHVRQFKPKLSDIPRDAKHLKGQAVPIMQWSDWHVEKRIDAEANNGLNEFNPEIARQRAQTLFINTARMIDIHRHASTITQGVLHLGGDFIEGYLRDHNLRENYMTPIEAVPFAAELIINGITFLLSTGYFDVLYVLESLGNHPRLTKKMDSDNYKMNMERLIYHMVERHFAKDKRVIFVGTPSGLQYLDIMGKRIRAFHGHQITYNGGVGGLAIPLRKAILNWDQNDPADYNMMGHFHQSYKPLANVNMNGSLCGFDWFAHEVVKAAYQPPLQSMELLVEDRGFRMFTSIDCE